MERKTKILFTVLLMTMMFSMAVYAFDYTQNVNDSFTFFDIARDTPPITISDGFHFHDTLGFPPKGILSILTDSFSFQDIFVKITFSSIINYVTTTITSRIAVIGTGCGGSDCYHTSDTSLDNVITNIIFPIIILGATVFGFIYIGVRAFGAIMMIFTFVFLTLTFVGIFPSWFNLIAMVFISAAFARLLVSFLSGSNQ